MCPPKSSLDVILTLRVCIGCRRATATTRWPPPTLASRRPATSSRTWRARPARPRPCRPAPCPRPPRRPRRRRRRRPPRRRRRRRRPRRRPRRRRRRRRRPPAWCWCTCSFPPSGASTRLGATPSPARCASRCFPLSITISAPLACSTTANARRAGTLWVRRSALWSAAASARSSPGSARPTQRRPSTRWPACLSPRCAAACAAPGPSAQAMRGPRLPRRCHDANLAPFRSCAQTAQQFLAKFNNASVVRRLASQWLPLTANGTLVPGGGCGASLSAVAQCGLPSVAFNSSNSDVFYCPPSPPA